MQRTMVIAGLVAGLVAAESAPAQSTLIPVPARRDHVFDPSNNVLYISTSVGTLQRYSLATNSLLTPWAVGTFLNGIDVTPDGTAVYVAEDQLVNTKGVLHRVNTATGAVKNIEYSPAQFETGTFDIKIANNGRGLLTSNHSGSGWTPLRELAVASDTLTIRNDAPGSGPNGQVRMSTHIARGSDRSLLFLTESQSSSGPILTYDAGTNTFPHSGNTGGFLTTAQSAVNRNGSLIAIESGTGISIRNPNLSIIHTLAGPLNGGMIFDPNQDILYAANATTDTLIAFNTNTWTQVAQWNIGENIPVSELMESGALSISDNGARLAMSTPSGVRLFNVPEPQSLALMGIGFMIIGARRRRSL